MHICQKHFKILVEFCSYQYTIIWDYYVQIIQFYWVCRRRRILHTRSFSLATCVILFFIFMTVLLTFVVASSIGWCGAWWRLSNDVCGWSASLHLCNLGKHHADISNLPLVGLFLWFGVTFFLSRSDSSLFHSVSCDILGWMCQYWWSPHCISSF